MAKTLSKSEDAVVGFCLDESSSMSSCWQPTIDGFNKWLKDIRKQRGRNWVTLTQFSQYPNEPHFRVKFENTLAKDVKKLDTIAYRPHGNTPLYDAIGHTIARVQKELDKYKKKEEPSAVVVIQTDGQENVSSDFSQEEILKLIEKKEEAGWTFVFLAANMSQSQAEHVAASVGLPSMAAMAYSGETTADAFAATSDMLSTVKARRLTGVATASADAGGMTRSSYASRTGSDPSAAPDPSGKAAPKVPRSPRSPSGKKK